MSIAPKPATLDIGTTVPLTATVLVAGGAPQSVAWSTSNSQIATVSDIGVVTGHLLGDVTITATSTFDPEKKDIAQLEVIQPDNEPATVEILSLRKSGTEIPVDPQTVAQKVDVTLLVSPGERFVSKAELLIGTTVVASKTFSPGDVAAAASLFDVSQPAVGTPFTVLLTFNSASFDVQNGTAHFLNGPHTLTARLTTLGGVAGGTASAPLTFSNTSALAAVVSASGGAGTDGSGRQWISGDLTVRAIPISYTSASLTLVSATISYPGLQNKTAGSSGTVTWPRNQSIAAGGSQNYSNNGGIAALAPSIVASVISTGVGATGAFANDEDIRVRLDNRAPQPGILALTTQDAAVFCCSGGWIGSSYVFSNGHSAASDGEGVDGSGVAQAGITYHAGSPGLSNDQLAALPATAGSATLAESDFSNVYTVVARVSDRVGNVALTRLAPSLANPSTVFGVDKTAPTLAFNEAASLAEGAVNPAALLFATLPVDTKSGFTALPVMHRFVGNFSSSLCFLGGVACAHVPGGPLISASVVDNFYIAYEVFARDQAGNVSPTITRTVLVDHQPPTITAMPVPAIQNPNVATEFTAAVADNVDLNTAQHRLEFAGFSGASSSIPFRPPIALSGFGAPLLQTSNVIQLLPFVRSIELTTGAGVPTGTLSPTLATRFRVLDHAGNVTSNAANFPGGAVPAGNSASELNVQTFRVTAPALPTGVCAAQPCGLVPTSITLTAEASGPAGQFNNPFGTGVFFYWVDSNGVTQLIGNAANPTVGEVDNVRRWTWSLSFSAPGAPAQQNVQVFAIGVDAQGDALRSPVNANVLIISP